MSFHHCHTPCQGFREEAQQPILAHAPNFNFHSCLYFSHHSSSHVWRVSPQTIILNRACSSGVQATPSNSPFVTGAWLQEPTSRGKQRQQEQAQHLLHIVRARVIWCKG